MRALEVERLLELQRMDNPFIKVAANHDKGEEVYWNVEPAGSGSNVDAFAAEMQFHHKEGTFQASGAPNPSEIRFSSFSMPLSLGRVCPYSTTCFVTELEGSQFRRGDISSNLSVPPPSPRWKALDLLCEVASVDAAIENSM